MFMKLEKVILDNEILKKVFFIDESDRKQGKSTIEYKHDDVIIESEYYDGLKHGYTFYKNKKGNVIREEKYWYGYAVSDDKHFKKLMAVFRIDLNEKKYEF